MNSGFGKYLKDYLEFYNISQSEFAMRLGITQKHMNELLNGKKDITLDMAINIERLTKIPVSFIIKAEHRKKITKELLNEYETEKNIDKKMKSEFCLKELNERKWVEFNDITNAIQNYMDIMDFLKVRDIRSLEKIQENTLFKKKGTDLNKLNLWLSRCDEIAITQKVKEYNSANIAFLVQDLLKIAYKNNFKNEIDEEKEINEVRKVFNDYGFYFVVEKALDGTKVRGAFKVKLKNPAIYVTKNYKGKDSFYFEILHEIGHCKSDYNEAQSKVFVEATEEQEKRADKFALDNMIKENIWNDIIKDYNEPTLLIVSKNNKIPMSFIVGRLAKTGKIKYNSELYLKYNLE